MCLAVALGLAVRLAAVLAGSHLPAPGDAFEYLGQANLLADGKGWIEPFVYAATGHQVQTAKLPPLYTLTLSLCSLAGFKGFLAHRIWSAVMGTSAVALAAVVGRDIAGRGAGALAAFGIAVYPNVWMADALGMSETLSPVVVLIVLWAAYRMWRRPTAGRAAVLGVAVGFAALARDELVLLAVFVLLPLALGRPGRPLSQRARLLGAGALAVALVIGPWIAFNTVRFSRPVLISDRFGVALASANCDESWHGPQPGYWNMTCAEAAVAGVHGGEPAQDAAALRRALSYVDAHLSGLPGVEYERLGRTFGFYRPLGQVRLDSSVGGEPLSWAFVGLGMYYCLAALAIPGAWVLRRRRVPIFPLVAVGADVVVAVLVTYGQTRFRASLEPVLVLLASVAVAEVVSRAWRRRAGDGPMPCLEPAP
ncbi:MAG: glycosyltransferase family 39 protein [Acidimicrobiales bacterium]